MQTTIRKINDRNNEVRLGRITIGWIGRSYFAPECGWMFNVSREGKQAGYADTGCGFPTPDACLASLARAEAR